MQKYQEFHSKWNILEISDSNFDRNYGSAKNSTMIHHIGNTPQSHGNLSNNNDQNDDDISMDTNSHNSGHHH